MDLPLDNPATVAAPFGDRFAHVARFQEVTRLFLPGAVLEVEVTAFVPAGDRGRG